MGDCFINPDDPACPGGGGIIFSPSPEDPGYYPPIIVVPTQVPDLSGIDNAISNLTDDANLLKDFGLLVATAIGKLLGLIGLIWTSIVQPLMSAIAKLLAKIVRIIDKILKPYLDYMKTVRKIILDIYNTYLRPIIVLIQSLRRIIALLHLFHIHVLDGLDKQLAKLEAKLTRPLIDLLRRTNTLGGWIGYILNARGLFFRGLLLGSIASNIGGITNIFYNAQTYNGAGPTAGGTVVVPPSPAAVQGQLAQYAATGTGPIADFVTQADASRDAMLAQLVS